jgi:hypothetical protein
MNQKQSQYPNLIDVASTVTLNIFQLKYSQIFGCILAGNIESYFFTV